jgi:hypothetical protein
MRTQLIALSFIAGAALAWTLAGCRGQTDQGATPPPGASPVAGAALGTPQPAGPFEVVLSTENTAKVGDTRFEAKVTRDGQPVTDATVNLSLSMPTMQMVGPDVMLKPAGEEYEGTANLSMGGQWQAKTTVTAGGDTGTAIYSFDASQ